MKNTFLLFLFLLSPFFLFSQGEFNQWRFGWYAGLDFNFTPPVSVSGSSMYSYFSSASISDSLGNLLFYSNGESIWNKNNQLMPNGNGLNGTINTQAVYAVKSLNEDSTYFLFTNGVYGSPSMQGLFYSVIDMSLNEGLGDVVSGKKNIRVPGGDSVANWMSGTRHRNNKDAWVIVRAINPNVYLAYSVTSSGINPAPVSSSSLVHPMAIPPETYGGSINLTQDGKKLITSYNNNSINEICDFNNETGVITPLFTFQTKYRDTLFISSDYEFSLNSRFVYLFAGCYKLIHGFPYSILFQYDATLKDSTSFMQSEIIIDSIFDENCGGLKMGPDGKIYCAKVIMDSLGVIQNPNLQGTACNFQRNAISLQENCGWALPQFLQKYKAYIHYTGHCQMDSVHFIRISGHLLIPFDGILGMPVQD